MHCVDAQQSLDNPSIFCYFSLSLIRPQRNREKTATEANFLCISFAFAISEMLELPERNIPIAVDIPIIIIGLMRPQKCAWKSLWDGFGTILWPCRRHILIRDADMTQSHTKEFDQCLYRKSVERCRVILHKCIYFSCIIAHYYYYYSFGWLVCVYTMQRQSQIEYWMMITD